MTPELSEGRVRLFCQSIFPLLPVFSVSLILWRAQVWNVLVRAGHTKPLGTLIPVEEWGCCQWIPEASERGEGRGCERVSMPSEDQCSPWLQKGFSQGWQNQLHWGWTCWGPSGSGSCVTLFNSVGVSFTRKTFPFLKVKPRILLWIELCYDNSACSHCLNFGWGFILCSLQCRTFSWLHVGSVAFGKKKSSVMN